MKGDRLRAAVFVLTIAALSACGRSHPESATAAGDSEDMLQVVGPWEIVSIDPLRSGYLFTRMQATETFLDAADDGSPRPAVARDWSVSSDGLTWRFELRPNIRFHDGTTLVVADVLAALERARHPPGSLALAPIASIEGAGSTITIALRTPFAQLPALLAHSSTQVLAPSSFGPGGAITTIVGTGPYRVVEVHPPQSFDVVRFDGWDGPRPAVERARYLAVARSETRGLLAESGQADVVFTLDPATLVRFKVSQRPALVAVTMPRSIVLLMNAGLSALSDIGTRKALSLAIDRPAIARAVLRDPEMAATQLFPPTLRGWYATHVAPLVTDVSEADRLLREVGWTRGRDSMLIRDGQPFHLELRTFPDRPELPIIATVIQEQFRRLGVRLDVQIGNSGDIPLGHRDGSLQLGLSARTYTTVPDPVGTLLQDFGPSGGDWGAMNWSNAELTDVLNELSIVPESPQRDALKQRAAEILQNELPVIPIAWYRQTAAVRDRVAGVTLDPLERSYRIAQITWATRQQAAR